jgi:GT2 family glycosyltransferase
VPNEIFGAKTACTLVRRDVFKKIGGFDQDYFVYFVDPDLSWRIWQLGFRVVMSPDSIVYHKGGTTNVYLGSGFVVYQSFKNRIDSLIKNLEPKFMFTLGLHILVLLMGSILFVIRLKPRNSLAIWRAIIVNLLKLNKTLRKRSKIQRLRKLGDKEIFERTGKPISLKYFWSGALEYTREW